MVYICTITAIILAFPFFISCYGVHELFNEKDLLNSKDKLPDNTKTTIIFLLFMIGAVTITLEYTILNMMNPGIFTISFK